MAGKSLSMTFAVEGLRETRAALRQLPSEADAEIRERSRELAEVLADRARANASKSPHARLLKPTIRVARGQVPAVAVGGSTPRVGRHRVPPWAILFGSEFGMNKRTGWYSRPRYSGADGYQYMPHRGQNGFWFFPVIEESADEISRAWRRAADDVLAKFGGH